MGALAVALWMGWVVFVVLSSGPASPTGRLGGDFPAFWGAGQLVLEGRGELLWDWDAQFAAQEAAFPEPSEIVPYPYAPPVALAFAPLALFPYRLAYVIYTLAMAGATWLAVEGLVRLLPRLAPWRSLALLAALGFPPLFRASAQGQNTAIVLCLIVWIFVALREDREALAGVLLGMLWFKPTYAAPLTGLLLLDRHFRLLALTTATLTLGWIISAVVAGPGWLLRWIDGAAAVQDFNFVANLGSTVSVVELAWEVLPGATGTVTGVILLALIATGTVLLWHRARDWPSRMALVTMATLAMAPHAYWYDLGLMISPLAFLAATNGRRSLPWLAVPVVITVPVLLDIRLGPLWVLLVLTFLLVVVRHAHVGAPEQPPARGEVEADPEALEARL